MNAHCPCSGQLANINKTTGDSNYRLSEGEIYGFQFYKRTEDDSEGVAKVL